MRGHLLLRTIREYLKLTHDQLADELNITVKTLKQYEANTKEVPGELVIELLYKYNLIEAHAFAHLYAKIANI